MSKFLLVFVVISRIIFLWLRLNTFLGFSIFSFFIILLSLLLFHHTPLSFDLILSCPTNNVSTLSATHRASNVYAFLTVSKPRTPGFQTCRTSLRSRFNKPKSRFSAALRHIKPACRHPIRVPSLQTALRLFKAHAAVSSRLPPAHSTVWPPDSAAFTSIDKPLFAPL